MTSELIGTAELSSDATTSEGRKMRRLSLVWPICVLVLGVLVSGFFFLASGDGPNGERYIHITFHNTGRQDFVWLAVMAALLPVLWRLSGSAFASRHQFADRLNGNLPVYLLAGAVFVVVGVGTQFVALDFPLSMDEYMMRSQAQLVQNGHLLAQIADGWMPFTTPLRPEFLIIDTEFQYWAPGYRPGTAFLSAGFGAFGAQAWMNATLCALSVLLLWSLARTIFESQPGAVFLAVVLFATSAQFLVTGMTPYTMTAHLFASLLWLWLFVKDKNWTHVGAICVGAYAIGLHHIHVHLTFAFPFLVHLFFVRRRFALGLTYGAVYAAACVGWIFWMDLAEWVSGFERIEEQVTRLDGGADFVQMAVNQGLSTHGVYDLAHWASNFTRLVAWQNLAFLPLIVIAFSGFRGMPLMLRLLFWSVITSLLPYIILMPAQGHGYGYRYLHQVLGNIALLAGFGWVAASRRGWDWSLRYVGVLGIISIVAGLPLRMYQTHSLVTPFARAMDVLEAQETDLVFLDERSIWYGVDLVRNALLLNNTPKIFAVSRLGADAMMHLCDGRTAVFIGAEEMRSTGLAAASPLSGYDPAERVRYLKLLQNANCLRKTGVED